MPISDAIDNLKNHQRQLDADGTEVGVSREALEELIAACEVIKPLSRASFGEFQKIDGWTIDFATLKEIRRDAGEWSSDTPLEAVEAIALVVEQRILGPSLGDEAGVEAVKRAASGVLDQWQDISTAPTDGTPILCFTPDYLSDGFSDASGIDVLWWDMGAWQYDDRPVAFQPTRWMPLPTPPVKGGDHG